LLDRECLAELLSLLLQRHDAAGSIITERPQPRARMGATCSTSTTPRALATHHTQLGTRRRGASNSDRPGIRGPLPTVLPKAVTEVFTTRARRFPWEVRQAVQLWEWLRT
jgi:hypothetical protein